MEQQRFSRGSHVASEPSGHKLQMLTTQSYYLTLTHIHTHTQSEHIHSHRSAITTTTMHAEIKQIGYCSRQTVRLRDLVKVRLVS